MNKDKTIKWCEANVATCREDIIDEMTNLRNQLDRYLASLANNGPMCDFYGDLTPSLRRLIDTWRAERRMLRVIRNMEES